MLRRVITDRTLKQSCRIMRLSGSMQSLPVSSRITVLFPPLGSCSSRDFKTLHAYRGSVEINDMGPFKPPKPLTFEQVEQRVMKAVRAWDRFPEEKKGELTLDSDFVRDMGFDSLDHVEIVMSLEDEFGFEIPDTDAEKLKTPRDIFKYVCEREDVFE